MAASPGAASGKIYFTSEKAKLAAQNGEKVVIVRQETSPEDIEGMIIAEGILTSRGGMTSHAAVVARGMGKCCVAGASEVKVDEENEVMRVDSREYHTGDIISIDGSTGEIFEGEVKKINPTLSGNFEIFMKWVDEIKRLKIKANADTPQDATQAIEFGADGIGLCRTEHMFFKENRIIAVREMIIAKNIIDRKKLLIKLFHSKEMTSTKCLKL